MSMKGVTEMSMIDDERNRALRAARMEGHRTGRAHRVILTTCYRALEPRICWALYLDRGAADARFRAYGD